MLPLNAVPAVFADATRVVTLLGFFWSLLVFVTRCYYKDMDLLPIWILIGMSVVTTIANHHGFMEMARFSYDIFACVVLAKYYLELRGYRGVVHIAAIFCALLVVQAISALVGGFGIGYANRVYINYFFGLRVRISDIYIFAVALLLIVCRRGRVASWVMCGIGVAAGVYFILYEQVSTAIGATLVFALVLVAAAVIRHEKIWQITAVVVLAVALAYNFVAGNMQAYELFTSTSQWFITDFLGESDNLSGRTLIWQQAIDYMSGWHWLVGNGFDSGLLFYLGSSWSADTAHSQYLDILFYLGLCGLGAYIYMLVKMLLVPGKIGDRKVKAIILAATIALIFMGIPTTTYKAVYMYIFYVVVFALPALLPQADAAAEKSGSSMTVELT